MQDLIGKSIGRYHIKERLGEGGMAVVYLAEDLRLHRQVAIKMIRISEIPPSQLPRLLERFKREAEALARLSDDPAIVTVHDYGEYEGTPYLVMAYMPGGTLKDMLGKPMDYRKAAEMLIPVTRALGEAHQEGIIHRDVKPSNLLVDKRGQLALADFGIAKALELEGQTLTGTGLGVGTPEYMAPEQWRGKASPQTDVYSLGVVLYEMVTGKKPFQAENPSDIYLKQMTEAPKPPRELVPGLPQAVEDVLSKAMHKDAAERFETMDAFCEALQGLKAGAPLHGETPVAVFQPDLEATYDELITPAEGAVRPVAVELLVRQAEPTEGGSSTQSRDTKSSKRGWQYGSLGIIGVVAVIGLVSLLNGTGKSVATSELVEEPAVVVSTATDEVSTEISEKVTQTPMEALTAMGIPTNTVIATMPPTYTPTPAVEIISPKNAADVQMIHQFKAHDTVINDLDFSPDGTIFASGSDDGKVRIWDAETYELLHEIDEKLGAITSIDFSPDGMMLAAGTRNNWVSVWDTAIWEQVDLFDHQEQVRYVEFYPNNQQLASIGQSAGLKKWDLRTKNIIEEFSLDYRSHKSSWSSFPSHFDLSSDGEAWAADGSIHKNSGTIIIQTYTGYDVRFSNDGEKLVTHSERCSDEDQLGACSIYEAGVEIWNAYEGQSIGNVYLGGMDYHGELGMIGNAFYGAGYTSSKWKNFSFSQNDQIIITTSSNLIKMIDVENLTLLVTLEQNSSQIMCTEFPIKGTVFITADYMGNIFVWGLR